MSNKQLTTLTNDPIEFRDELLRQLENHREILVRLKVQPTNDELLFALSDIESDLRFMRKSAPLLYHNTLQLSLSNELTCL